MTDKTGREWNGGKERSWKASIIEEDAVSLGSAMYVAVGAGAFADLRAAGKAMVHVGNTVEPDTSTRSRYDEGFALYKETYAALAPLFQRVSAGESK